MVDDDDASAQDEVLEEGEEARLVAAVGLPRVPHDPADSADREPVELAALAVEEVDPRPAREARALLGTAEIVVVPGDARDPAEPLGERFPDERTSPRPPRLLTSGTVNRSPARRTPTVSGRELAPVGERHELSCQLLPKEPRGTFVRESDPLEIGGEEERLEPGRRWSTVPRWIGRRTASWVPLRLALR